MTLDSDSLSIALTETWDSPDSRFLTVDQNGVQRSGSIPRGTIFSTEFSGPVTFSRGIPWLSEACSRRWLGDRLFLFPDGIPLVQRTAIVSSRIRQRLDLETWWFDSLRTLTLKCDPGSEAVLVAKMTTSCEAASRAAMLFGRPLIRFEFSTQPPLSSTSELEEWIASGLRRISETGSIKRDSPVSDVLVSPELLLSAGNEPLSDACELSGIPPVDRVLFAAATRVHVLSCRPQGHVADLLKHHLQDEERREIPVLIAADSDGRLPPATTDLPAGWIPWLLEPWNTPQGEEASSQSLPDIEGDFSRARASATAVTSSPLSDPENWLLHWTRATAGPWPGETREDFLDALILRTSSADRSAMATLLRIISSQRLASSSEGIRGGHSVVAFTDVPLTEFRTRRVFRKHRHRFDFEPWGVAIRKDWLQMQGGKPVIYGNDNDWGQMEAGQRPWFQKDSVVGGTSNSSELEWRIIGDVDLSKVPKESIRVFVENTAAADVVSQHCDWATVIVPGKESPGAEIHPPV